MSERESAWILTNQVNARLTVVHESGRTTIVDGYSFMDDFKHVLGNNSVFNWQNYLVLAGISISGIENAIFNPRAKHATFSKKGNIFSRIAHVIQTGYQFAAAGAVQPQHSGVLFKWEEKDLHKYALKWMNALGKSTSGKVAQATDRNNARELALMENEQMTSFYRFVSDTEIKALSPMEAQTIRSKQEELQKAYRAEHQGAEPGKRVFYL